VELPEHDVRRQIGCRLMNLGNSCYQNCILQILVNLPDVRERLVAFAGGHQVGGGGGREGWSFLSTPGVAVVEMHFVVQSVEDIAYLTLYCFNSPPLFSSLPPSLPPSRP